MRFWSWTSFTFLVGTVETQCTHQPGYGRERSGCQLQGLEKQWKQGPNSVGIHKDIWLVCSHFQSFQLFSAYRLYLLFWHYPCTMVISAKLPDPLCCQGLKAVMEQQGGPASPGKASQQWRGNVGQWPHCWGYSPTAPEEQQSRPDGKNQLHPAVLWSLDKSMGMGMSMLHKEVKSSRQRQNQTGTGLNSCKVD